LDFIDNEELITEKLIEQLKRVIKEANGDIQGFYLFSGHQFKEGKLTV